MSLEDSVMDHSVVKERISCELKLSLGIGMGGCKSVKSLWNLVCQCRFTTGTNIPLGGGC